MTEGKHLEDWTQLWEKTKGVFQRRKSWDRTVRESFELIESALIYHRNALAMYAPEAGGLHRHLRVSTPAAPPSFPWTSKEPLFSEIAPIADVKLKLGNSFIASASLRLPVAVLKAIETSISPFGGLLSGDGYWNLEALGGRFEKLKKMGCCRNTSSPGTNGVDGLGNAIAMVVCHRDDFGHGEVGFPPKGKYRTQREGVLDSLYVCRLLQAQRELSRWVLARIEVRP